MAAREPVSNISMLSIRSAKNCRRKSSNNSQSVTTFYKRRASSKGSESIITMPHSVRNKPPMTHLTTSLFLPAHVDKLAMGYIHRQEDLERSDRVNMRSKSHELKRLVCDTEYECRKMLVGVVKDFKNISRSRSKNGNER